MPLKCIVLSSEEMPMHAYGCLEWMAILCIYNALCGRQTQVPCRFQNINYRVDTQFVLFTGGIGNTQAPAYNIVAQSPVITNVAVNQPVQVNRPASTPAQA